MDGPKRTILELLTGGGGDEAVAVAILESLTAVYAAPPLAILKSADDAERLLPGELTLEELSRDLAGLISQHGPRLLFAPTVVRAIVASSRRGRAGSRSAADEVAAVARALTRYTRKAKQLRSEREDSDLKTLEKWLRYLDFGTDGLDEEGMYVRCGGRAERDEVQSVTMHRALRGPSGARRGPLPFARMAAELVLMRAGKPADGDAVSRFLEVRKKRLARRRSAAP